MYISRFDGISDHHVIEFSHEKEVHIIRNATACCGRHICDRVVPEEVKESRVQRVVLDLEGGWPPLVRDLVDAFDFHWPIHKIK
jgi:hypothetical protein